jgi:hypothetical protein
MRELTTLSFIYFVAAVFLVVGCILGSAGSGWSVPFLGLAALCVGTAIVYTIRFWRNHDQDD